MLDTMDAYGALNYGESEIPKDVLEQKYEVANAASASAAQASAAPTEIDLVTWFQKAGYMPYVSGDVTFRDIVAQWQPSDWDKLIDHIADKQILKDAPPQEQARFKDYLYSLREQAASVAPSAPSVAPQAAPTPAPKRGQQTTTLAQPKTILNKVAPMPIVQLALAGVGYYAGKYFDSPYIGAAIGASAIPIYKSRAPQVVYHSRKAMGAFLGQPDMVQSTMQSYRAEQQAKAEAFKAKSKAAKLFAAIPIGLGTIAIALSYSRNQSILKSIGAGFIAPIYLAYVGIDYAKKKMK